MSTTRFLTNVDYWQEISKQIKSGQRVSAAIAYLGNESSKLLPLKRGDRLVVNLSLPTLKSGATNPYEIEKLIDRGVSVFCRKNLHAKTVVAGSILLTGSANVSKRSRDYLEEAGIITNEPVAVRRAADFVNRLCTDLVTDEFLTRCKSLYRPPQLSGSTNGEERIRTRTRSSGLWIVNLRESAPPKSESSQYAKIENEATAKLDDGAELDSFHWPSKPRMADELEFGDRIIRIFKFNDGSILVFPPAKYIQVKKNYYVRDRETGRCRWVFPIACPSRGEAIKWDKFRALAAKIIGADKLKTPRTQSIPNTEMADRLVALWTLRGRVSKKVESRGAR